MITFSRILVYWLEFPALGNLLIAGFAFCTRTEIRGSHSVFPASRIQMFPVPERGCTEGSRGHYSKRPWMRLTPSSKVEEDTAGTHKSYSHFVSSDIWTHFLSWFPWMGWGQASINNLCIPSSHIPSPGITVNLAKALFPSSCCLKNSYSPLKTLFRWASFHDPSHPPKGQLHPLLCAPQHSEKEFSWGTSHMAL